MFSVRAVCLRLESFGFPLREVRRKNWSFRAVF